MDPRRDLADRRKALGLSQVVLAQRIGVDPSTVVRWERGHGDPQARHRPRLAEILGISLDRLTQIIDGTPEEPTWPQVASKDVPFWLNLFAALEHGAGRIDTVEQVVIPGLTQTREYATASMRHHYEVLSEREIAERVGARMARQRVLDRLPHPVEYRCVVDEAALTRRVGDDRVMLGQLDHLVDLAGRPNIEVRVMPATSPAFYTCAYSFSLFSSQDADGPFVLVSDDSTGIHYVDDDLAIGRHVRAVDFLRSWTYSPAESVEAILAAREVMT